jgi:tRNA/tmRNA/rRNA uracil-C5-methylase (TrmA/RlmC/RlmD family)
LLPESCDAVERIAAALQGTGAEGHELELSENVAATERGIAVNGRIVSGESYVHDTLSIEGHDVAWRRHVLSFFQGNRYLIGDLVTHVVAQIDRGTRVVDLYAGGGLFTLPAAVVAGSHVTAVEGDRSAAADLAWNAKQIGAGAIDAVHQSVESFVSNASLRGNSRAEVVIVDPPRTGMSKEGLAGAIALGAARLVYVSCDVATLARDAKGFVGAGYKLSGVDAFDMFPNTPHVETVAVFVRP